MKTTTDILIIGAGASGLMCGRILSKSGKKVIILEARNIIGGRIRSYPKEIFGYKAEAGAEFVHGNLPLTQRLIKEAGLTILPVKGQMWNARDGYLQKNDEFIPDWDLLMKKLKELKDDIPILEFLNKNCPEEKYSDLYKSVKGFVEGFDAADPSRASTLALRDEWSSENQEQQFRIKEGYEALIQFLKNDFTNNGGHIHLNKEVKLISLTDQSVLVKSQNEENFEASKVILTIPLPLLNKIYFNPPIPEKLKAISEMGYGKVIKFIFRFKNCWWENAQGKDLSKLGFIFSNEDTPTWWTQYPENYPVLTGWLGGPNVEKYISRSYEEFVEIALVSLSKIFKSDKDFLKNELVCSEVINWGADPFAAGAYAYATPETTKAKAELLKPVNDQIFFSGEALYEGKEMGTVEAALASGERSAKEVLELS